MAADAAAPTLTRLRLRIDENRAIRPDGADWPTLHFCLKEAAYKAFYPKYRRNIGFQKMRLQVNLESRQFNAEITDLVL